MKFEIHQPDEPPKKKFEINPPVKKKFEVEKPRKKFEIQGSGRWFQQENSNDCGPCLILNALNELGIQTTEHDIKSVREKVSQSRGQSELLRENGWFRTSDVGRYLSEAGLGIDEYATRQFEKVENLTAIKQIFDNRLFDFIYITLGNHFRGIVNKDAQLILLDSFNNGPQVIENDGAWKLIENTVNSSEGMNLGVVGIVRRNNPGYRSS